jgi:hypothetical protein
MEDALPYVDTLPNMYTVIILRAWASIGVSTPCFMLTLKVNTLKTDLYLCYALETYEEVSDPHGPSWFWLFLKLPVHILYL